jgi:aspartate kinase
VKDAGAVRNVAAILRRFQDEKLVVVVSAMGKTTNLLERLHQARYSGEDPRPVMIEAERYHRGICDDLFGAGAESDAIMASLMDALRSAVSAPCTGGYDEEYDQVVSMGECFSTVIVHAHLAREGIPAVLFDARQILLTDSRHRDARVDWTASAERVHPLRQALEKDDIAVIQGFIGATAAGRTTTLGREGSDFTASILAYLLDAKDVTIWKDVPGMLNADPKKFPDSVRLPRISFREAIELAYYGASVIHPKTIKPLQNKGIPLRIRSFVDPEAEGSVIQENTDSDSLVPSYIFKDHQVLASLSTRDFSFVVEDNLRDIFDVLATQGVRIHLMENSAISFSMCMDHDAYKQEKIFEALSGRYEIRYNEGLTLVTIRHYDEETVRTLTANREILLEQRSRNTVRLIMR